MLISSTIVMFVHLFFNNEIVAWHLGCYREENLPNIVLKVDLCGVYQF